MAQDAHGAGLLVDLDLADLRAVRERDGGRREGRLLGEAGLHALRQLARHVGGPRDVGEGHAAVRARHRELPVLVHDVLGGRLQEARRDAPAALDDLLGRARHRRAAHGEGARAAITAPGAERVAVTPEHLDALGRHAEPIGHDLGEGRLVSLPHRRRAGEQRHGAVGVDPQRGGVRVHRGVGPARHLDRIGNAEPAQLAVPPRLRAPLLEAVAVGEGQRHVHAAREIAAVVGEDEPGLERHRRGRDQIAAAQLARIDLQLAGRHVDDALDGVRRLRAPGAAVRPGGGRVREDAGRLHVDRRRRVDPGDAADVVGARPGAPRREIGADVERDRHAQRQEFPVRVQRQLGGRDVVAAVLVGDEALAPIGRPLDRPPEALGRPQHQHRLGIHAALHAEASADLAGDHVQIAVRHLEHLVGEQRSQTVRRLDTGVQRVAARATVPLADRSARLHRRRRHTRHDEVEAGHVGGAGEPARHRVAISGLPDERDVVGRLRPHRRRAGAGHLGRRRHGRQRLVVDRDELRRVDGL